MAQRSIRHALDVQGAQPLGARVAARLRDDLTRAGARSGDRLPSERHLAQRYEVSRVTVRRALHQLEQQGLVASSPSRGWFVAEPLAPPEPGGPAPAHTVRGFADSALESGHVPRSEVLEHKVRASDLAESDILAMATGSALFELRRLRYLDGLVLALEHNRVALSSCPALIDSDFRSTSLYATLREADPPQYPSVARYAVRARPPTMEEAGRLEVTATTPVLVARQLSYNQHGRPLELTTAVYRGDRYRFEGSITD